MSSFSLCGRSGCVSWRPYRHILKSQDVQEIRGRRPGTSVDIMSRSNILAYILAR